MQRQKIRPSFGELQGLDKEFNQSDGSDSNDGVPEYAPAATPYRGVPPPVIASSSKLPSNTSTSALNKSTVQPKVVRIAPSSSTQVHEIEGRSKSLFEASRKSERSRRSTPVEGPESFRFNLDEEQMGASSANGRQQPAPLIGTIQERVGLKSGPVRPAERKNLSKFAQQRKGDRSSAIVSSSDVSTAEWLDEDGEPMSAFRKARLIQQGRGPPSSSPKEESKEKPVQATQGEPSSKTGAMDPFMQAISEENEAKLRAMSVEEMQQSLQDLQETFGSDMLEKLKRRRAAKTKAVDRNVSQNTSSAPAILEEKKSEQGDYITQRELRSRFFSNEPEETRASLGWTKEESAKDVEDPPVKFTLRFDFSGMLVEEEALLGQDTYSAGLHHHGDEQQRAGYSLDELLHLARSTLPSQCAIALQTLERIFIRYGDRHDAKPASAVVGMEQHLTQRGVRGKAAVIASWYIDDRQVSVKTAALRCLAACSLSDIMEALSLLPKGQEKAALNLISIILPKKIEPAISEHLVTLAPFINEMLRVASHHQGNVEDESLDPLSGIELWQSASTGLPLRPDWPFIALDDLLHSGNCASLNRKNALSSEWDANERQIVTASLDLGLHLWTRVMQDLPQSTNILPTSAEVQLAIIKVFMLEEDQSQGGKATGLITGRDLFRDDRIATLLAGLFDLAKQLDQLPRSSEDDLEKAATRHYGSSLPFYQLYTNFIGLYDSISFGMELFGRALLLAQSNQYAGDYRRLLWIDYAHCLATMQTTVVQSPFTDLKHFLCSESKDDGILQAMANVLLRRTITKERNELLFHIAVQQIGHTIWYTQEDSRRKLAEAIFRADSGRDDIQEAILQYNLPTEGSGTEGGQRRLHWLDSLR